MIWKIIFLLFVSNSVFAADYNQIANNTFRKLDNSLSINIIPSTYKLDWSSSGGLLWSILKNKYYFPKSNHFIGHVSAEVNCLIDGEKKRFFLGQSTKGIDGFRDFIIEGYGFSILNNPNLYSDIPLLTVPGTLDNEAESYHKFDSYIDRGIFSILSFRLKTRACVKILNYMEKYTLITKTTKRAGNNYGFGVDPLKFEGAGCAPLVQSLFQIGEISDFVTIMNNTVFIPYELLGEPKAGKKVGLMSLIINNFKLKEYNSKYRRFDFPDPQNLYDHVSKVSKKEIISKYPVIQSKLLVENVWFLLLDSSNI